MTKILFRSVALFTAIVVTSPAWASWNDIASWLPKDLPQPNTLAILGIAVAGVLIGRFASRKRQEP